MQGSDPVSQLDYWVIRIIIIFSFTQLLLLGFVLTLAFKLERLMHQVHDVSRDAGKFLKMSMTYFKSPKTKV